MRIPRRTHAVIVIPCLNEASSLRATCRSLGFGIRPNDQRADTTLVIVDNGSTDDTLTIAQEIQRSALPGTVILGQENERGYVPPRRAGNLLARQFANASHLDPSRVLILQADADTRYSDGYVEAMLHAAGLAGPHTMLEGIAEIPPELHPRLNSFLRLTAETDERVFSLIAPSPEDELICTDAVCAYRLSDYFDWGGHQREYVEDGEEVYAESTRLRIRSLPSGGRKILVEDAVAFPSERKILLRPGEEFATAGFPRGERWRSAWRRSYSGPATAEEFGAARDSPEVLRARRAREHHLIALFGLLPIHAARAVGATLPQANPALLRLAESLPRRDSMILTHEPARLITDVLEVVDYKPQALDELLD
jgi:glycosyltransferase involved in cell wall biosynthesis